MANKKTIEIRREKVAQMIAKSITSIEQISTILKLPYDTVQNDVRYLKSQVKPYLYGLAEDGYAFDCKTVIDKLIGIERELEEMRDKARKNEKASTFERLSILKQLTETSIARLNVEAEGPTLMAIRRITKGELEETNKPETKA